MWIYNQTIYPDELYHYGKRGMKWGVRRYQNEDGSLTDAGKKRYSRDLRENDSRKKENRIKIDGPDPSRWVREDLVRTKRTVDAMSNVTNQVKSSVDKTNPKPIKKKMDLSSMSDKELKDKINRAYLEKQYNDIYGEELIPKVNKGRKVVNDVLEYVGTTLAIGSSALGIALAIKELKG